jgi:hypothetical protein
MTTPRWLAVVTAALVMGLVAGGVGLAMAATGSEDALPEGAPNGAPVHARGEGEHPKLELFAELTGLTEEEIREAKQAGQSFAKIAEEAGVSSDALIDEMYGEQLSTIEERLADGLITDEQAQWMEDNMRERIEERVMSEGAGHRGPGMPGGMPGRMGPPEGAGTAG